GEARLVAEQKAAREVRTAKTVRGFGVARRGEVEQRERGECFKVPKVRVKRSDEVRCCVEFAKGLCTIIFGLLGKVAAVQGLRDTKNAQERKRKAGRKQRI